MDIVFPDNCASLNALPLAKLQRTLKRSNKDAGLCCRARCTTPHGLDDAYPIKEEFKRELQAFRRSYEGAKASRDRDNAIANVKSKLALLMCEKHQVEISPLFECYVRIDKTGQGRKVGGPTKERMHHREDQLQGNNSPIIQNNQLQSSEIRSEKLETVALEAIRPYMPTFSKLEQNSDSANLGEDTDRNIQVGGESDQTPSSLSPHSSGSNVSSPSDIFDKAYASVEYGTPETEIDDEEVFQYTDHREPGKHGIPRDTVSDSTVAPGHNQVAERASFPRRDATREQVIKRFHLLRRPRAAKTRLSYLQLLKARLGKKALEKGTIYIAKDKGDDDLAGCHKIGFTTNTVEKRYYNEKCDRRHNMKFIRLEENEVPYVGAHRVEQLLQLDFYVERLDITNCAYCERGRHIEWFKVGEDEVVDRLRLWKAFITAPGLYDCLGNITTTGTDAIDRILHPNLLIRRFLSDWKVEPGMAPLIPNLSTPKEIRELWAKAVYATDPKTGSKLTKGSKQHRAAVKQPPSPSSPTVAIQAHKQRTKRIMQVPDNHAASSSDSNSNDASGMTEDGEPLHRDDTARVLLSTFKENNQKVRSARMLQG